MIEFTVTVEFYVDGAWLDVTRLDSSTYVMGAITITRGRTRAGQRMAPMKISFRMRDDRCVIDGENPRSPYWRKIVQGTQVRVSVDGDVRGVGEIATIDQVPGPTPEMNFVDITAAGALRRLDIPQRPLRSAAFTAFASPENDATRVFYAPLEEESDATHIEVLDGRGSVADDSPISLGGDTVTKSSARLVRFGTSGKLEARIPVYTSTQHRVCMLWRFPENGLTNGHVPVRLHCTGGNIDRIHLRFNTPWMLVLDAMRGFTIADSAVSTDWTGYIDQGQEFFLSIELTQNGANVDCAVGVVREDGTFSVPTDTLVGVTVGRIWHITVGANDISGSSFGHLALGNSVTAFDNYIRHTSNVANGVNGYRSEYADTRMQRLLTAADVDFSVRQATLGDAVEMGPQRPGKLGDLIYEGVDADDGILVEDRDFLALVYATRFSLYNQIPAVNLRLSDLSDPFKPVVNDVELFNDYQVTRPGGTSERYVIPDGDFWHRTTEQPPDGVGPRPGQRNLNLWPDEEVGNHAAWRAHTFSWREKRFDKVTVDLHRPALLSADRDDLRALDPGDVLAIDTTGAPPYVPYTELRLLVQGYTETLDRYFHRLVFNTSPADVYEVDMVDADGSYLAQPIDADDTVFKIAPPSLGPTWTEDLSDLPYNIQIDGQPMRVDAISTSGTGFISAGTLASGSNTSLVPALPVGPFQDSGDSFWLWATIRNSGTGTVDDIPNWERIVDFGNCALFACHYTSNPSIVAPTVTFTGGVANATTMAQIFAFSNISLQLASGTKGTPAAHTQLNSSAQNIAYPAITVTRDDSVNMIFAWKQDDWTSVAPPSGYTEMTDSASTTGDDSGIWAGYDLTGASGAAGSLTVTGGVAAISRAVVLSLRPLQSITVTRGIAGDPYEAFTGAEIHAWRPGVNAL